MYHDSRNAIRYVKMRLHDESRRWLCCVTVWTLRKVFMRAVGVVSLLRKINTFDLLLPSLP